jgi:hypothetical protein
MSGMFRAPLNPPPSPDDEVIAKTIEMARWNALAAAVLTEPVLGARGQQLDVAQARERADGYRDAIEHEEAQSSQRHRRVALGARITVLLVVAIVDFPLMFAIASSVFNVSWDDPGHLVRIGISLVVAVLGTWGAAAALWHIGHDLRQHKNHRRQLDIATVGLGGRLGLAAVAVLTLLVAAGAFYRVYTEGVFSGDPQLAALLAALVAVVLLVTACLVFATAFKDGSPERDDMSFYGRLVSRHLARRRGYLLNAADCQQAIQAIEARTRPTRTRLHVDVIDSADPGASMTPRPPSVGDPLAIQPSSADPQAAARPSAATEPARPDSPAR